ncbi:MAG: transglycosylase domain-containing protein, partial [Bacteroidia bacterium]|nr:transglycosylase domain-containing protein [Bacteroidia bacterium]
PEKLYQNLTGKWGGSTITQRLARLLYDEQSQRKERGAIRKLQEAFTALILERRYTKKELLTFYLNHSFFGGTNYGIEQAAEDYFRKRARFLTIEESALLTGMLFAPSKLNPRKNPAGARKRRDEVIKKMQRLGKLSPQAAQAAMAAPVYVEAPVRKSEKRNYFAGYFRQYVLDFAQKWCNERGLDMFREGLRIYTTLDSTLQSYAEAAAKEHLREHQRHLDVILKSLRTLRKNSPILARAMRQSRRWKTAKQAGMSDDAIEESFTKPVPMRVFSHHRPEGYVDTVMSPFDSLKYYARLLEPGMVALDHKRGHVLAWVGGLDYQFFQYDHVHKGKRQVGSTFKPFVYAAALEAGFKPCDTLLNQPPEIVAPDGDLWVPRNADHDYGGYVSLRYGVTYSINVVTARLIQKVGPEKVVELARKMGVESELKPVPSIALGTFDLSVLELTAAYQCFPTLGLYRAPTAVMRIEDRKGRVLATFKSEPRRAFGQETGYAMVELLRAVATYGTAANVRFIAAIPWNLDVAGKTGTTQGNSDGWFVGFTPALTAGVWVGCADRNVNFNYSNLGRGSYMAMPIWSKFVAKAYADPALPYNLRQKIVAPVPYRHVTYCPFDPVRKIVEEGADTALAKVDSLARTVQQQDE